MKMILATRSSLFRCMLFLLGVLSVSVALPAARGQMVVNSPVVPGGYAEVEGNAQLSEPFSLGRVEANSVRLQQVYASSEFLESADPNGGWIYSIGFRADEGIVTGSYSTYIPNLQIRFSVTHRGPDELSPIFAENIGANVSLIVSGGRGIGVISDGVAPETFSLFFTFSRPYFYDPSQGNLLLDVINLGGGQLLDRHGNSGGFDAVNIAGDGVSSVIANDIGNQVPIAGTVSTKGLVTSFRIVPVPEPSTWALLGLATVIFGGRFCHTLSRRKAHHVTH